MNSLFGAMTIGFLTYTMRAVRPILNTFTEYFKKIYVQILRSKWGFDDMNFINHNLNPTHWICQDSSIKKVSKVFPTECWKLSLWTLEDWSPIQVLSWFQICSLRSTAQHRVGDASERYNVGWAGCFSEERAWHVKMSKAYCPGWDLSNRPRRCERSV